MIKNRKTLKKKQPDLTKNQFILEADQLKPGKQPQVFQVSDLTRGIKAKLEGAFDSIWVEGEISNFRTVASGHSYLSLRIINPKFVVFFLKGISRG